LLSVCSFLQQRWQRGQSDYHLVPQVLLVLLGCSVQWGRKVHKVLLPQLSSLFLVKELEEPMERAQRRILAALALRARQVARARRERRVQQAHRVYLVKLEALVRRGRPDPPVHPDQQEQRGL
jgi:hypothetical protein